MIAELVYEDDEWKSPLLYVEPDLKAGDTFKQSVSDHPCSKWLVIAIDREERRVFNRQAAVHRVTIQPHNWPPAPRFRQVFPEDVQT